MRTIPSALATDLAKSATTLCYLLKVMPSREGVGVFGITTLDQDVVYDDGDGALTYRAKTGYTAFDVSTDSALGVDNSEAESLMAVYPTDGMTIEGINRGDYDSARFVQYLINYNALDHGHAILNGGQVGQVLQIDDLTCHMEMRSLTQILKQDSIIELTSITCRARFGDERCKMPLRWYDSAVDVVGAESDREFTLTVTPGTGTPPGGGGSGVVTAVPFGQGDGATLTFQLLDSSGEQIFTGFTVTHIKVNGVIAAGATTSPTGLVTFGTAPGSGAQITWDGTVVQFPNGYFVPGIVHWLTGQNAGSENEVESYNQMTGEVTLAIPANSSITAGDTLQIRRDCDYSKTVCKDTYDNLLNMRAEPELPRADGTDLMTPTTVATN